MKKKLFCTLLCVLLLFLTVTPVFAEESYNRFGDIDNDNRVGIRDYMLLKRYVLGTFDLSAAELDAADLDSDQIVDAKDYMLLKRLVLGTYTFPSDAPDKGEYISSGVNTYEPISQYAIAYQIAARHDIHDDTVSVEVSYGLISGCDPDAHLYTDIKLYACTKNKIHLLGTMNILEINMPEYEVKPIWDEENMWITGFVYTHSETVEIPISMFADETGEICFVLTEYTKDAFGDEKVGSGAYADLYYQKNETTILFGATPARMIQYS